MQRDILVILFIAVVAIMIGAGVFFYGEKGSISLAPSGGVAAAVVPFDALVHGMNSSVPTRTNYLITSSAEFEVLWSMLDATGTPPAINFSTHNVVAVFAGRKPTGGYGISVSKIEDKTRRMVTITLRNPAKDCMLTQQVTEPYELVIVPKTALPFTHEDVAATANCGE